TQAAADAGVVEGRFNLSIEDYSVGERQLYVINYGTSEYEYPDLPGGRIHGTVGNSFFQGFAVGLHFREMELWITAQEDGNSLLSHPEGVGAATSVDFDQPSDYLVLPCAFDSPPPTRECLLDTGSPEPLSFESYWSTLDHPSNRIVPLLSYDWEGTPLYGYFQRAEEVVFGDLRVPGVHVSVFDRFETLEQVVAYLRRDIVGLVGLAAMRQHFAVIDYANNRLVMFPYDDLSHLPTDEFVGFGMVFDTPDGYELFVDVVVPGSQAEQNGVLVGDFLLEVDGTVWWYRDDIDWLVGSFLPGDMGESHLFKFERGGEKVEILVAAEDLLPPIE
ncbi:PDZ domain-containing protein, partial [Myxococcota bacterium]